MVFLFYDFSLTNQQDTVGSKAFFSIDLWHVKEAQATLSKTVPPPPPPPDLPQKGIASQLSSNSEYLVVYTEFMGIDLVANERERVRAEDKINN